MLSEMSWPQFMGWLGYAEIEPFGEERADARIAQLAALYANSHRSKGHRAFTVSDFMLFSRTNRPSRAPIRDPKKWQASKGAWRSWAAAGGTSLNPQPTTVGE